MKRTESIIVNVFLAVMLPLTLSIFGWWMSALLYLSRLAALREAAVINGALLGFGLGIIALFSVFRWVKARFYTLDLSFMAVIFLFWSFVSIAFLRGVPAGTIIVGMLAGLYVGRRSFHAGDDEPSFMAARKKVSRLAAAVTGGLTLFIGVLMLRVPSTPAALKGMLAVEQLSSAGAAAIVIAAGIVLSILQYAATAFAASRAFRLEARSESVSPL